MSSILVFGGCGSVTPAGSGVAGSSGGDAEGTAGRGGSGAAGTTGMAGTGGGNAGTTGGGGAAAGGRGGGSAGNAGTTGAAGAAAGGRGGSDGTGAGGRGGNAGNAGTTGAGGVATAGRGGGAAGTSGTGTGGVTTGGRGGAGGVALGGRGGGGGNAGTGGAAGCARGMCPALTIANLEAIDDSKAPGFDAPGFRCKSLTICPLSGSCVYFSTTMLGSLQSAEDTYMDGAALPTPGAVKLSIDAGAASQCNDPAITFTVDEFLTLTFDGGKRVPVYLPAFMGRSLSLYIASDGSTFYDAALTMPARLRP